MRSLVGLLLISLVLPVVGILATPRDVGQAVGTDEARNIRGAQCIDWTNTNRIVCDPTSSHWTCWISSGGSTVTWELTRGDWQTVQRTCPCTGMYAVPGSVPCTGFGG